MPGNLALVREIDALGQRWLAWRQEELRERPAVERWGGCGGPLSAPEITVGPEAFQIAGEILICLHPGCGGFMRGLVRCENYVYWLSRCHCPACGQRYRITPS